LFTKIVRKVYNGILDGETKNNLPKWGGVSKIINVFDETVTEIERMSRETNILTLTEEKRNSYNSKCENKCRISFT
jgi:hypothetical protein